MLISRSQDKLEDVARSLGKSVCICVCPQHHRILFEVWSTASGLRRVRATSHPVGYRVS